MITLQELHNLSWKDLLNELRQARHDLYKTKASIVTKKTKNTHQLEIAKKQVARILTVMTQVRKEKESSKEAITNLQTAA